MLARVARTLHQLGRDLERAEWAARLLEASQTAALERGSSNGAARARVWEPVLRVAGELERFTRVHRHFDERSVSWFLSFGDNPDSVAACLGRAREGARVVRGRLPTAAWEAINDVWLELDEWPPVRIAREGVYPFCTRIRRSTYLVAGIVDQTMPRDEGWQFMRLGRFLERAERSLRLVRAGEGAAPALVVAGGAGLSGYFDGGSDVIPSEPIRRLLVMDARIPHSVAFCLNEIETAIQELGAAEAIAPDPRLAKLIHASRSLVRRAERHPWSEEGIDSLLARLLAACTSIATVVTRSCFVSAIDPSLLQYAQAAGQAQN